MFFLTRRVFCSAQNQEESRERHPAKQLARVAAPEASRNSGTRPQVYASAGPYDAVPSEGHRARHPLRGLRQHPARHPLARPDLSKQTGWPTAHLCGQMGEGFARWVSSGKLTDRGWAKPGQTLLSTMIKNDRQIPLCPEMLRHVPFRTLEKQVDRAPKKELFFTDSLNSTRSFSQMKILH